jgi:hypothetical protein
MAGILYYTDNQCQERIALAVRKQLLRCVSDHEFVAVSQYPIDMPNNIVMNLDRSVISMYKQILKGLERLSSEIVFFAEHDVFYHPCHFSFTPESDTYYFNTNIWTILAKTGETLYHAMTERTSAMVAKRKILVEAYTKKIKEAEEYYKNCGRGFGRKKGYEPKDKDYLHWFSLYPTLDVKHGNNITKPRFDLSEYTKKARRIMGDSWFKGNFSDVPYWKGYAENFDDFLRGI